MKEKEEGNEIDVENEERGTQWEIRRENWIEKWNTKTTRKTKYWETVKRADVERIKEVRWDDCVRDREKKVNVEKFS